MSILSSLRAWLSGESYTIPPLEYKDKEPLCIGQIRGQEKIKVGLLIAAAGKHNVLLVGPPGEGKSALLSTIPGFLPFLTQKEYDELATIYDRIGNINKLSTIHRPFIQTSPGITESGLLGGGHKANPGAISLAHNGILFIDEFPEYKRNLLESLRNPMEDGMITLHRSSGSVTYQCNFQLLAAMNPCPCGLYPSEFCRCNNSIRMRYRAKLSQPILDRIDIIMELFEVPIKKKFADSIPEQSAVFKQKVDEANAFRLWTRPSQDYVNSEIQSHNVFHDESKEMEWEDGSVTYFQTMIIKLSLSTRKVVQLARIARTVADLAKDRYVGISHLQIARDYIGLGVL